MARGNQREVRRTQKNKETQQGKKHMNTQSGTEYQRTKESDADKMRAKQKNADLRKQSEDTAAKPKTKVVKTKLI